jgi:hypothetical protein
MPRPIARFGGSDGIREPAVAGVGGGCAQAGFGGASLSKDLVEVAAAYLFYLCPESPVS